MLVGGCNRESPSDPKKPMTSESREASAPGERTPLALLLLHRTAAGELEPFRAPLVPSLPNPVLEVNRLDVTNLRPSPDDPDALVCDLSANGTITSDLCDQIPGRDGVIDEVRLVVNDAETPFGLYPVGGGKSGGTAPGHPFRFEGSFAFTAEAVPVTEGNNTFRITGRDRVYGLDGHSLWAASFAIPFGEDGDASAPAVEEEPRFLGGGSGGETAFHCLALEEGALPESGLALAFPSRDGARLDFKRVPGASLLVPVWEGTTVPALFTVRPTMRLLAEVPSDATMVAALKSHPGLAAHSGEGRFLHGFGIGVGFEGYDLVFDSGRILPGAGRLTEDGNGIRLDLDLADSAGKPYAGTVVLGPGEAGTRSTALTDSAMPVLLWRFTDLYRRADPLSEEVVLSLLLGELSNLGLDGVSVADWREHFYSASAEMLETLITEANDEPEAVQGYYLGRMIGDALRIIVDPTRKERLEELGKAEFLSRLMAMPSFRPENRAALVPR